MSSSFTDNKKPSNVSNGTDGSTVSGLKLGARNSHLLVESHQNSGHQTSVIIIFSISAAFVLCSLIALLVWKRTRQRSRKLKELNYLTCGSSLSSTAHLAQETKPDHSIESIEPTLALPESTLYSMMEDSIADSDHYPSDQNYCGTGGGRHSTYLSVCDIGREYRGPKSGPETAGKINFVLHYSFQRQQLSVTLVSASDLPASERKGSINPFAKIVLLPETGTKFHTKVHRNSHNPIFNEKFILSARKETLDERCFRISIWDSDWFNRKFLVGQVVYNLAESGITSYISEDVATDEIICPLSLVSERTYRLFETLRADYAFDGYSLL